MVMIFALVSVLDTIDCSSTGTSIMVINRLYRY